MFSSGKICVNICILLKPLFRHLRFLNIIMLIHSFIMISNALLSSRNCSFYQQSLLNFEYDHEIALSNKLYPSL